MAALPYVTAPGNIKRALDAIASAATPERVSQDFVKTILKIPGGSGDQMTAFLKRIGFASPDGAPTDIYKQFRNEATRGAAVAAALRKAYEPLYKRNEYMHALPDARLRGLIIEETGAKDDASAVANISSAIRHLKSFADFSSSEAKQDTDVLVVADERQSRPQKSEDPSQFAGPKGSSGLGLNLGYTINLNLPATSDIAVFNAIFKSLRENLLKASDE